MLLGVEESAPTRSAQAWDRAPRSDSADEPRQSPLGCTKNPRRAVEARPNGLAGDGVEVHGPASEAAVAGVADIFEEPRPGSDRVGFLHGAHRDLSSPVRARDTDPQPAPAGASPCHGASDSGMDGARSEEHTSELQSRLHLVCRLLLEKKKKNITSVMMITE